MGYYNGKKVDITYTSDMNVETFRNNVSNAIVETATGTNAVKIPDINPLSNKLDVSLEAVNLINQEDFFKSINYVIEGEVGKTYTLSYVPKANAPLTVATISETNENGILFSHSFDDTLSLTIEKEHTYIWDFGEYSANDLYESVSMVLSKDSLNEVKLKSYGKNLFDLANASWNKAGAIATAVELFIPSDCVVSIKTEGVNGFDDLQRVYVVQETTVDDDNWKSNIGTLVSYAQSHKPVAITKKKGYKYRIYTNDINRADHIKYVQVETGMAETAYEEYKKPVDGAVVLHPTTTLVADTNGVQITATYNKDATKVYQSQQDEIKNLKDENLQQQDEIKKLKNAILNMGGTI